MGEERLVVLERQITQCRKCPRLVDYREEVARAKRRASLLLQFFERLQNVLAATDLRRIALWAHQNKIVVHHGKALDAVTLREKFLFG